MLNKKKIAGAVLSFGILASGGMLGSTTAAAAGENSSEETAWDAEIQGWEKMGGKHTFKPDLSDPLMNIAMRIANEKDVKSFKSGRYHFDINPAKVTKLDNGGWVITGKMVHQLSWRPGAGDTLEYSMKKESPTAEVITEVKLSERGGWLRYLLPQESSLVKLADTVGKQIDGESWEVSAETSIAFLAKYVDYYFSKK